MSSIPKSTKGPGPKLFTETTFTRFPSFFISELMHSQVSKGIPPVFWKMTFVAWQRALKPTPQKDAKGNKVTGADGKVNFLYTYELDITEEQWEEEYGVGDEAARKFTRAYSVSGLFDIRHGFRKNIKAKGVPTIWKYRSGIGKRDWSSFVVALRNVLPRHTKRYDLDEFTLDLAIEVDKVRATGVAENRLPSVNEKHIARLRGVPTGVEL
jgi:hypothetical protein